MKKKTASNGIPFLVTDQGNLTQSLEDIAKEFIHYFTQLFGCTVPIQQLDWSVFSEGPCLAAMDVTQLTKEVEIQEGRLPVKYLGLPLTSQRATERDFAPLVDIVDANIRRWNTKTLSLAGRSELIRTVIQGIEGFWFQAFPIHKSVLNRIISLCRSFLWGSKFYKVAWDDICKPKEEGGLGIRNSFVWNQALLAKNLWNIASNKETLWVQWVHSVYLQGRSIWTWIPKKGDSHLFKKLAEVRDKLVHNVGDAYDDVEETMSYLWEEEGGNTAKLYDILKVHGLKQPWMKIIWQSYIPPRYSVTAWMALRKRLPTKVNLSFVDMDRKCSLCNEGEETIDHLFFECTISKAIWKNIRDWLHISPALSTIERYMKWVCRRHGQHGDVGKLWKLSTISTIHHIWKLRNAVYFDNQAVNKDATICQIKVGVYKVVYRFFPNVMIALFGAEFAGSMTVGCPTSADVKTPVFSPSEGMTGMAEAIFGLSGVTIVAAAAVGPITEVTGADPIVALDPTKVVIGVDPMAALDPKRMLIEMVCPTEPPNPAETFTAGVSKLLPFPE
ncbi:unnamed protein product [Cuscuta campestris]|uniref:Reverse transcriptase zinc-binding domain-containing protein n=1 Tax=Cuscuta campestris TaxID=132261 RepID=A0A484MIL7_9ASTE|nr:unnamed protein product [Cuscuta campestris]